MYFNNGLYYHVVFRSFSGLLLLSAIMMYCIVFPNLAYGQSVENEGTTITYVKDAIYTDTIFFKKSSAIINVGFNGNRAKLDSITCLLSRLDGSSCINIDIKGSSSPEGSLNYNRKLASNRAEALVRYVKGSLNDDIIRAVGHEVAPSASRDRWPELRFAKISIKYRTYNIPTQKVKPDSMSCGTVTVTDREGDKAAIAEPGTSAEDISPTPIAEKKNACSEMHGDIVTVHGTSRAPKMFLNTNLLYDVALTPNIGVGVYLGKDFTLYADWMHAWWSCHDRRRYWRVYGGDIELRRQLGHGKSDNAFAGHYIGVYASLVTYDFQFGRKHTGVIGDKYNYAVGLSYGYTLPIAKRLDLNFSIGLGYMWGKYMKQHLVDEHDVWILTHNRRWFGPTRAEVGLTWLIGKGNVNSVKGGAK